MVRRLLDDPAGLRGWIDRLAGRQPSGLTDQELEALAEARFRLALHPGTSPGERLLLLQQAWGHDPRHPKYAYHLACAYLRHGRLDEATHWLGQVQEMCPASHRVWVHTSLLQRELHRRYRDDEAYEPGALLRRATALLAAVEQGAERVEPDLLNLRPPEVEAATAGAGQRAPAPATTGPCRWSGVHDLLAEELLETPPSAATRDRLYAHLAWAAREGADRTGGVAAFTILAVAWVAGGYPVAAVRRLRGQLPPDTAGGALELLELVCELHELDHDQLASNLAAALRQGRIPPLLAALVHHRRLLAWRRLRFPTIGPAYRAARVFAAGGPPSWPAEAEAASAQAAELAEKLHNAAKALDVQAPAPVPDAPPVTKADRLAHARGLVEQAERRAAAARQAKPRLSRMAKRKQELDDAEREEAAQARAAVAEVEQSAIAAFDLLSAVREDGDAVQSLEELEELEQLESRLRAAKQLGPVRKVLSNLGPTGQAPTAAPPAPSGPGPTGRSPTDARPVAAPATTDGFALLRDTLGTVDRRVGELFDDALASFDPYGPDLSRWPPLRALRAMVRARYAETRYRLGQHQQARQLWREMRREDPGRPAIARNIAVADAAGLDRSTHTASWRTYLETLYSRTILSGSLHTNAEARAQLHLAFAGASAPRSLVADLADEEGDDEAVVAGFLTSRRRLRSFTRHSLLAFLADKLDLDTATLLLGVARTDDEQVRTEARQAMLDFITDAGSALPPRVRDGYVLLASARVKAAFADSDAAEQRTLAMEPTEELERHLQWLQSVCELKLRLAELVRSHLWVVTDLDTLAFADELTLLDRIPVNISPDLLSRVRPKLRTRKDGPALQHTLEQLRDEVVKEFPNKRRGWP
jgi:hypothetical protein